ncbi:GNAT family N-acetyltransferase [Sulfoacidibacillus ferrooxidans]|uniref:N-acetyltransferase domain-containing protein n=1 Tax=Sulfoacidibacillus ferrooxidans TaxID=2005001 RepID=A0A9X2AFF5_9BACL|nr:GNAT family N-acetyltransferase [Sulfoacidibacillus ferrooxidans]MCI0184377.1 hypothetical protein [Sulfoacidibacillus ferrooxidans]
MAHEKMRMVYHQQLRYQAKLHGYLREETEYVVRYVSQTGDKGYIMWSSVNSSNALQVIRKELAYFSHRHQKFEWKVYDYDQPHDLIDLLKEEGFSVDDPEAVMVVELDATHPLIQDETHITVCEIIDQKGIQEIIDLEESVWNMSFTELREKLIHDKKRDTESLSLYGVYESNQLISGAWMYIEPNTQFVSLWGGSTLPSFRKKGYYTALLRTRAQKALEKGHVFLTVDASPMSRPILEKYGFVCIALASGCQSQ